MEKILFTTSYTNHSREAFRYAQQLAYHFGASITVAHIYLPLSSVNMNDFELEESENGQYCGEFADDLEWQEKFLQLQAFVKDLAIEQFEDIEIDCILTEGEVVNQLLEIQQMNRFDLVIMGMRRHNRLGRLFGNTTYEMIHQMDCPLLLIPPDTYFMGIEKMMYTTAFELEEQGTISWLLEWCSAFDAQLEIIHVTRNEKHGSAMRNLVTMLRSFEKEKDAGTIHFQILDGTVADLVKNYISKQEIDLLIVHHRKKGIWQRLEEERLTKSLSEDLKMPLLVLK